jgi:hypothetical protein
MFELMPGKHYLRIRAIGNIMNGKHLNPHSSYKNKNTRSGHTCGTFLLSRKKDKTSCNIQQCSTFPVMP